MSKITEASVDDLAQYKSILLETVKRGYATTVDEPMEGITALSLPVFDFTGKPVAAVSVLGIKERIQKNKEYLLKELKKTADNLTRYSSMK